MTNFCLHKNSQKNPKLSLFDSVDLVNGNHWNKVVGDQNVFLTLPYLSALEKALSDSIDFKYTIFYNKELKPVAVSYVQIMHIEDNGSKYSDFLCRFGDTVANKFIGAINARVLVCGNVFATGENGFAFTNDLNPADAYNMLSDSLKRMSEEKGTKGQISFGLLKEFWPESFQQSDNLEEREFKGFMIDVNMVLKIRATWVSFDDYLNDMTTKFRTKAKGVFKKSAQLEVIDLDLEQIKNHKDRIEELYKAVLESAEFKFGELNAQAFVNFKANLREKFVLYGYFLDQKLVGFSTAFLNNGFSDANYVGVDYEYNKDYAIYQRMLCDLVKLSIDKKQSEIRLGRTAELIKSSIGAEPVNMKLYLRHRNSISNKLIGPLISSISPSVYELRPPFKKALL